MRRNNGVQGLAFVIQSDKLPSYLDERIEAFILWTEKYLQEMSEQEFETNRDSLISRRLEKPKQILSFSRKLWSEIDESTYFFDRDEVEVDVIKTLTKEDILEFFKTHIKLEAPLRKKLQVRILSKEGENEVQDDVSKDGSESVTPDLNPAPEMKPPKVIRDVNEFKNSLGLYPLPSPRIDIYNIDQSKL